MKKIISLLIAAAMIAAMLPTLGLLVSAETADGEAPARDTSWYDEDETSFTVSTAAELLGFSDLLASGKTFAGKKITLGADIDLNPDWTAGATAPANVWADTSGKSFGGTLDGDGHKISGIYLSTSTEGAGIFGIADDGATLKNLVIDNSYLSVYKTSGALFAWMTAGAVNITNVYCDVDVTASNQYCGGFMGRLYGGTLNISNCVYAGDFVSTHAGRNYDGGFVGAIAHKNYSGGNKGNAVLNISNSALYGTLKAKEFGGIVGEIGTSGYGVLNATNCIIAGDIDSLGYTCGSFYAKAIDGNNYITVTNCYYTELLNYDTVEYQAYPDGQPTPANGATLTQITDDELKALDAEALSEKTLGAWVARESAYPLPMTVEALLRGEVLELSPFPDDHWYTQELTDGTRKLFVIDSAEDLLAFSEALEAGLSFEDCTVELAASVDLNEGWSTDRETVSEPTNKWKLTSGGKSFAGTFDGKGYTISGIYLKPDTVIETVENEDGTTTETEHAADRIGIFGNASGNGVAVKDLVISNSYIASDGGSVGGLFGSVDGSLSIDGVYLDVSILNEGREYKSGLGGFVGTLGAGSTVTLANSVFAGKITTTQAKPAGGVYGIGGFIGTADATAQTETTAKADTSISLTDCGFFGTLSCKGNYAGGIVGTAGNESTGEECVRISLTNVIVAGSLYTMYPSFNGSVCGHLMTAPENLTATNCYHIAYRDSNSLSERIVYVSGNGVQSLEGFTLVSDMSIRGESAGEWLTAQALTEWTATEGYPMPTAIVERLSADALPGLGDTPNDVLPPSEDTGNGGNGETSGNGGSGSTDGGNGGNSGNGSTDGNDTAPVGGDSSGGFDLEEIYNMLPDEVKAMLPTLFGSAAVGIAVIAVLAVALVVGDIAVAVAVSIPVSVIVVKIDRKRHQAPKTAPEGKAEEFSDGEATAPEGDSDEASETQSETHSETNSEPHSETQSDPESES